MTETYPTPSTAVTAPQRQTLVARFAERYHIEPNKLLTTLKATAFRQSGDTEVSNEQMAALLIVADQYKLNPFTKEIFAFNDRGAVVPVVSVDGWARIINEHPAFDGMEFSYAEEVITLQGAKPCPAWCEVKIFRKDRSRPIIVREFLDEVYQQPRRNRDGREINGPWQTHTKRFLRHKTLIQGARIAFGFAGIYDEDEASRIVEATPIQPVVEAPLAARQSRLASIVNKAKAETAAVHAEEVQAQEEDQAQWEGEQQPLQAAE